MKQTELIQRHLPQSITQIMPFIQNNTLSFTLNLLRANLQRPNETGMLLPLSHNSHHTPLFHLLVSVGQPAPRRSQPGCHQRRTGEHEPDRATIDLYRGQSSGISVHELEVRDRRAVLGLVEEGFIVDAVQGGFLRSFFNY